MTAQHRAGALPVERRLMPPNAHFLRSWRRGEHMREVVRNVDRRRPAVRPLPPTVGLRLARKALRDWMVLHGGATAVFRVWSLDEAAQLAEVVPHVPGLEGSGVC